MFRRPLNVKYNREKSSNRKWQRDRKCLEKMSFKQQQLLIKKGIHFDNGILENYRSTIELRAENIKKMNKTVDFENYAYKIINNQDIQDEDLIKFIKIKHDGIKEINRLIDNSSREYRFYKLKEKTKKSSTKEDLYNKNTRTAELNWLLG